MAFVATSLAQEGAAGDEMIPQLFTLSNPFVGVAIAIALGLLVGLQRERDSKRRIAGIRTFPLITLLGCLGGLLVEDLGWWPLAIVGLGLVASTTAGAVRHNPKDDREPGITTEMAILVMFLVGVLVGSGRAAEAVVVTGIVALLLHLKDALHGFARRLGERDVRAVMQFTLITLVILPVLPNRTYGPFDVLNPREIWLFVVLVVGMSLAGYIAIRVVGERTGTIVYGLLGGAISSTATTVSQAQRIREGSGYITGAALAITLAAMVAFVRVLIEIGVVADEHFAALAPPIAIMLATMLLLAVVMIFFPRERSGIEHTPRNPAELKLALIYGLVFAIVIFAVAAAKYFVGNEGVYIAGILSGLADMDAITLSTARLVRAGTMDADTGWRTILLASMSNLVFKGSIAWAVGGTRLGKVIAPIFAVPIVVGVVLLLTW